MVSELIVLGSVYVLGFFSGFGAVCAYGLYRLRKFDQERQKFAQEIAKTAKVVAEKTRSAKARLDRAFEICEEQFNILSGMEGPQSGPLHGKHKQQMNAELKRLEEEKMTIFRSILADGFDPTLTTITETGEREVVKLSEFVKRRELIMNEKGGASHHQFQEPKRRLSLVKDTENKEE